METLTIHPKNKEQLEAIKSVLKALKIPFERKKSPYDPEFVKMIQNAEKDRKDSIVLKTKDDIEKFFEEL
jgi:antitoxin component of RelBE/YafQ-DinJ toxin-antitoxin module